FFPLPILPPNFNHSNLNFSTNGGAAIDPITLPTGTTVQLSQYIPLRDGYEFVGWCRDAALTRTITKVQVIDPNTVVYAKWSPIW
ncbi:MAG: InlB B-repeat-containing protein, partial [Clostridiales bacterium]|nr:InlB B-repeat-containing protein [Clostridiales bacterium]